MATELISKNSGKTNESLQAGEPPAKGKFLFRKIAPLVAAGFLAAGCGGVQPLPRCRMDKNGDYIFLGECVVPQNEGWKLQSAKLRTASKPPEAAGPEKSQQEKEMLRKKIEPFAFALYQNMADPQRLAEKLDDAKKHFLVVQENTLKIIEAAGASLLLEAHYSKGYLGIALAKGKFTAAPKSIFNPQFNLQFGMTGSAPPTASGVPDYSTSPSIGYEGRPLARRLQDEMIQEKTKTYYNSEWQDGAERMIVAFPLAAASQDAVRIFDLNINGNPNLGKVVLIYNDVDYVLFIFNYDFNESWVVSGKLRIPPEEKSALSPLGLDRGEGGIILFFLHSDKDKGHVQPIFIIEDAKGIYSSYGMYDLI